MSSTAHRFPLPSARRGASVMAVALVVAGLLWPAQIARADSPTLLCNQQIPMPDGVSLSANIKLPAEAGRYPTILTLTPYGKNSPTGTTAGTGSTPAGCVDPDPTGMAEHGYVHIVVDERGTGNSPGTSDLSGPSVVRDSQSVLDWIQKQSWSNGRVGNIGCSALGMSALYTLEGEQQRLAAGKPKALYATWADSPPAGGQYRDVAFGPGGAGGGAIGIISPAAIVAGLATNNPLDPSQAQAVLDQLGGIPNTLDTQVQYQLDGPYAYHSSFWQERAFDPGRARSARP